MPVVTATAVTKSVPVTETAVGTVESISTVQVRSQVTGRLAKVHFAEGDEVKAGQLLFTIDPQPFQVALDQANAALARDTAQADNAQAQLTRLKNLLDRGLIPREQYETQLANAAALKATTDADRAAVAAAELNLQYTRIMAPATGRTGALQAHEGDLIQAGGQAPLVVMNQLAPIYVAFSVPGKLLDGIRGSSGTAPLRVSATVTGSQTAVTVDGPADVHRQLGRCDDGHDQVEGHVRQRRQSPLARAVRGCDAVPQRRSQGRRRAVARHSGGSGGFVRVRRRW